MLKQDLRGYFSLLTREFAKVCGLTFGAALLSIIHEGDDVSINAITLCPRGI